MLDDILQILKYYKSDLSYMEDLNPSSYYDIVINDGRKDMLENVINDLQKIIEKYKDEVV